MDAEHRCHILEALPQHVLLEILCYLDVESLCFLAQTCHTFLNVSVKSLLWPGRHLGGPLVQAVRCSLSSVLHVPLQMFPVRLEEGRSSKFPLSVPLHNLRFVLGAADVDSLAERTSGLIQDLIARAPPAATYHPVTASMATAAAAVTNEVQHAAGTAAAPLSAARASARAPAGRSPPLLRPSAALLMCRADRGFVRLGLRPEVAVARVLIAAPTFTFLPCDFGGSTSSAPPSFQRFKPALSDNTRPANQWDISAAAAVAAPVDTWSGYLPVKGQMAESMGMHDMGHANQSLLDQLLALPEDCWIMTDCHSCCCLCNGNGKGGERSSGGGAAGCRSVQVDSSSGHGVPCCSLAAEVNGGASAAVVASQETAQLKLLDLALDGVSYAVEAWRGFVVGCHQVAARRLQLAAAVAIAPPGGASSGHLSYPRPQPLLAAEVAPDDTVMAVDEPAVVDAGPCREAVASEREAATLGARSLESRGSGPRRSPDYHPQCLNRLSHRHSLLVGTCPAPSSPLGGCSSSIPCGKDDAFPKSAVGLYRLCVSVRLRLLALMFRGLSTVTNSSGNRSSSGSSASTSSSIVLTQRPGQVQGNVLAVAHTQLRGFAATASASMAVPSTVPGTGELAPQQYAVTAGLGAITFTSTGRGSLTELMQAMDGSRSIALMFGKLIATVASIREGFSHSSHLHPSHLRMAPAAPAATATDTATASATDVATATVAALDEAAFTSLQSGSCLGNPAASAAAELGASSNSVLQTPDAQLPRFTLTAVLQALDDTVSAATCAEANLCLTTSEALLEVRAEIAAAFGTAAAAIAGKSNAVPLSSLSSMSLSSSLPSSSSSLSSLNWRSSKATDTAVTAGTQCSAFDRVHPVQEAGGNGSSVANASCCYPTAAAARGSAGVFGSDNAAATTTPLVNRLWELLSTCLVPAASRLLAAPTRYSPLGVMLPSADDIASSGGGGGMLGPAAGATRMGANLARAAAAADGVGEDGVWVSGSGSMDVIERREVLRGLLLSYLLQEMTWALKCLGVL